MVADPVKWRSKVSPLVSASTGRTASARALVRQHIMQGETYTDKQRIATNIIMTRRRFKNFRRKVDDMGSMSADSEFEPRLRRQHRRYCTGGEEKVAVTDDERETQTRGTRSSKISQETGAASAQVEEPRDEREGRRAGRSRSSAGGFSRGRRGGEGGGHGAATPPHRRERAEMAAAAVHLARPLRVRPRSGWPVARWAMRRRASPSARRTPA